MSADKTLAGYFEEAAAWDLDRAAMNEHSVRIAWRIAFVAIAAATGCLIALILLMPLKRVEPFLVRVDNTTGIVDVVPVFVGNADQGEAITRYLLAHYVQTCERFNFSTAESDYTECGAFHSAQRNQEWSQSWSKSNPASPLNVYKDGSTVRAQVSSISFFTRGSGVADLAQVRYVKSKRQAGAADEQLTHWVATVQYAYGDPAKDPAIRRWNPLGFKVLDFRPEPEVVTEPIVDTLGTKAVAGKQAGKP